MDTPADFSLGVDVGSHYTKFVVADGSGVTVFRRAIPTLSRRRELFEETLTEIRARYTLQSVCATGYGRHSVESDVKKPELLCASAGVSALFAEHKMIIDIGGEDIKIIESDASGRVIQFHMNDKCAAGTGAFIREIAEKAEIETGEMSELARRSSSTRAMNSFCTVFAKTEILGWKFGGVSVEDMARGIYLSVAERVCKLPVRTDLPVFLSGGVAAFHPYLTDLLAERLGVPVRVPEESQFIVASGAAVLAQREVRPAEATPVRPSE